MALETSADQPVTRRENPWRRLPWTLPLALVLGLLCWWAFAGFILKSPDTPARVPPINARFIELPKPPPPPPPPPLEFATQKNPQPVRKPSATKKPIARPATPPAEHTTEPTNAQPVESLPAVAVAQTQVAISNTPSRHAGPARRTGAAGMVAPPPMESVMNEENEPDFINLGQGLGGWIQEGAEPCEFDHLRNWHYDKWQELCGHIPVFSQPPRPWCHNAAEFVNFPGTCGEDFDQALADFKAKKFDVAIPRFRKLAEHDYAPAQFHLALFYAKGEGVARDDQQAVHWYQKAASEGNVKAIYNLAQMYSDGRGTAKDEKKALFWYTKAAYFGYAEAQFNMAVMYAEGLGVTKDDKQAAYWYRKSADRGNPVAQYNLAIMYAEGKGLRRDEKQAIYWFCKGATRGSKRSLEALTQAYPGETSRADKGELLYFCWLISNSRRLNSQSPPSKSPVDEQKMPIEHRERAVRAFDIWTNLRPGD